MLVLQIAKDTKYFLQERRGRVQETFVETYCLQSYRISILQYIVTMSYSLLFIIYLFLHLIYKLYVIIDTNEYRETEHTGINSLQLQPSTGGLLKCNL